MPENSNLNEINYDRGQHNAPEEQKVSEEEILNYGMPEDFVEPEGKKSKWKVVRGEVEIEGKKVEVIYREKVIELPRYRQEQTGIKRIRRRELLPPFPEGLYLGREQRRGFCLDLENKRYDHYCNYYKGDERQLWYHKEEHQRNIERISAARYLPIYDLSKKFNGFYGFLTDNKYNGEATYEEGGRKYKPLIHTMDYMVAAETPPKWGIENQERFKKEGLYFQPIYAKEEKRHNMPEASRGFNFSWGSDLMIDYFSTPTFIFCPGNKRISEYLKLAGKDPKRWFTGQDSGIDYDFPIIRNSFHKPLRWCHADCALVPTRRSLNVLFFETGEEDEKEDKK